MPNNVGPTLVYVHGLGSQKPCETLKKDWDALLFGDAPPPPSRMAYYADILHPSKPPRDDVDELNASDLATASADASLDGSSFGAQTAAGVLDGLSPEGSALATSLMGRIEAAVASQEIEQGTAQVFPPGRAQRFFFRSLLRVFFHDVDAYFFKGQREPMKQRLRDQLAGLDGPVVVIAHSLGSIIAYDVLTEASQPSPDIRLLVTIGAPLGIDEVQQQIKPPPLAVCAGVEHWYNFADRWDLVALDKTLSEEFAPYGRIFDGVVANPAWNHHSAPGYLAAPALRHVVRTHCA